MLLLAVSKMGEIHQLLGHVSNLKSDPDWMWRAGIELIPVSVVSNEVATLHSEVSVSSDVRKTRCDLGLGSSIWRGGRRGQSEWGGEGVRGEGVVRRERWRSGGSGEGGRV